MPIEFKEGELKFSACARSRAFMFVDEDHDALLAALLEMEPEYMEYVIEMGKDGIRIRGVCMFPHARSHSSVARKLGKWHWNPKPLNMRWAPMFDSFEQKSNTNTILSHVITGQRPVGQGARTDLKSGEYVYLPDTTAAADDCLMLPPPGKLQRSESEF